MLAVVEVEIISFPQLIHIVKRGVVRDVPVFVQAVPVARQGDVPVALSRQLGILIEPHTPVQGGSVGAVVDGPGNLDRRKIQGQAVLHIGLALRRDDPLPYRQTVHLLRDGGCGRFRFRRALRYGLRQGDGGGRGRRRGLDRLAAAGQKQRQGGDQAHHGA